MAEQNTASPIAKAGVLVNNDFSDYPDPQSLLNAFAAALLISVEAGETGAPGEDGQDGSAQAPEFSLQKVADLAIPQGATALNTSMDLDGAVLRVRAPNGHSTLDDEVFAPGVVEGQTVHFVFAKDESNNPVVARDGWTLEVWKVSEVTA